jgi:hypothetical protein
VQLKGLYFTRLTRKHSHSSGGNKELLKVQIHFGLGGSCASLSGHSLVHECFMCRTRYTGACRPRSMVPTPLILSSVLCSVVGEVSGAEVVEARTTGGWLLV